VLPKVANILPAVEWAKSNTDVSNPTGPLLLTSR
jgi:hypothetical protein